MNRLVAFLIVAAAATSLTFAGCASAGPASSPTSAPLPAAKEAVSQPTAAPTNQAAAAPVKKTNYPNKSITLIVPQPPGGQTDVGARLTAAHLEKELGVSIEIVNKAGAAGQVGLTDLVRSKPDGYTLIYTVLPQSILFYLDPDRKAGFGRGDIVPVANVAVASGAFDVSADSPYKTVKDLVDAAKAKPDAISLGDPGILSLGDIEIRFLQQASGAKFAQVHFDGGAPGLTAMLGGHIDGFVSNVSDVLSLVKGGKARVIGVADKKESQFLPGIKTMEAQGYPVYASVASGVMAPKGTPKEIVDALSQAIKKVSDSADFEKKMNDTGLEVSYMDTAQYEAYWTDYETRLRPIVASAPGQK